jgi:hypothetical protein
MKRYVRSLEEQVAWFNVSIIYSCILMNPVMQLNDINIDNKVVRCWQVKANGQVMQDLEEFKN